MGAGDHRQHLGAVEPAAVLEFHLVAVDRRSESASAWQPIISEDGNGQGWLE